MELFAHCEREPERLLAVTEAGERLTLGACQLQYRAVLPQKRPGLLRQVLGDVHKGRMIAADSDPGRRQAPRGPASALCRLGGGDGARDRAGVGVQVLSRNTHQLGAPRAPGGGQQQGQIWVQLRLRGFGNLKKGGQYGAICAL